MISEFVEYVKQAWKNKPNVSSPLNADRLNHMEDGIENNSKKIKEIVPQVNALMNNPIMVTWGGQFAYDDSVISSPAWARCIKYANGKCDIHIDTTIETNKTTERFYKIWDKARILSGFGINTLSFNPYQTRVSVDFPNMGNRLLIKDIKTGPYTLGAKGSGKWIEESNFPSVPGYKRLGMLNAQADGQTSILIYPNGYMENTAADTSPRTFSITSRWLYENQLVEGTKDHFGRTGLAFQSEADFFLLSRAYDANLQIFGGWGTEAAPLYAVGTVHHIDIWGADYT